VRGNTSRMRRIAAALALSVLAVVGGGCGGNAEEEAVEDFIAFAREPSDERWSELRFAQHVRLGVHVRLRVVVRERYDARLSVLRSREALRDPEGWMLNGDFGRAGAGPFSALAVLDSTDRPIAHRRGESPCVVPGEPLGWGDLPGTRPWAVYPREEEGCHEWLGVELLVSEQGEIAAVTLDLPEP
jgi:hypothetical protein